MVLHQGGSLDFYTDPYGFDVLFDSTVRAVGYR